MSDDDDDVDPWLKAAMNADPNLTAIGEAGWLGQTAQDTAQEVRREQAEGLMILIKYVLPVALVIIGVIWVVHHFHWL